MTPIRITLTLLCLLALSCGPNSRGYIPPDQPPVLQETALETKFAPDIALMEAMEADSPSTPGTIVFVGSSSITRWASLQRDMAPVPVLNRGFGGSGIRQVTFYAPRIILPIKPKAIFFYCGENDICNESSDFRKPLQDFKDFVALIRYHLADTRIIYIGMKPSPLRWQYWPKFKQANSLIKSFTKEERGLRYVEISNTMLDPTGQPKRDIWLSDSLHMNEKGYADWTQVLKPIVMEEYNRK